LCLVSETVRKYWKFFRDSRTLSGFCAETHVKSSVFPALMSFVHLTIVHKHTLYQLYVHYRTAQRLLEQGPENFFKFLPGKYRDAGWLVVDYDRKTIVSAQEVFQLPKTGLEIIEVT
jgi:hypothetical protein